MAIEEVIDVSVAGIGKVEDLAGALDKAAESAAKLKDELGSLGGSGVADGAGADKFAEAWTAAEAKISGSIGKIREEMATLGGGGALADTAGLDSFAAKFDAVAADVGEAAGKIREEVAGLGAVGGSVGEGVAAGADVATGALAKVDEAVAATKSELASAGAGGESLGAGVSAGADEAIGALGKVDDAAAAAGASIKESLTTGVGSGVAGASAEIEALEAQIKATVAQTAALQDKIAMSSVSTANSTASAVEKSRAIQEAAGTSLATTTVEQDAALAQSAQSRRIATRQAAGDAESAAGKYKMLGLAGAAAAAVSVDLAAKFQTSTDRLVTSAGESKANLDQVRTGILDMSVATDTSAENLASGAYWVESAGFHGQRETAVEKAVAEGSQAEGADLPTVANAETTVLTDYGMTSKNPVQQGKLAIQAMNEIITAVGQGKMTTQGLAQALPTVLPSAKTAGMSLPQVLGSLASMTAQGTTPENAAQEIRHTIGAVTGPNNVQRAEQQMLGIDPNQFSTSLGKQGLTGVVAEADKAIRAHTKNGVVQLDTMNQAALAMRSANEEITALPKNLQSSAKGFLDGTLSQAKWYALTSPSKSPLSGRDVNLLKQFGETADTAKGFNSLVRSGAGDEQTPLAALKAIFGGQVGAQVAQQLGGSHMGATQADVGKVDEAAQKTGKDIANWGLITRQFGFQMGAAKNAVEAVGIEAGTALLPFATGAMHAVSTVGGFLAKNPDLTKAVTLGGGAVGAVALTGKLASGITSSIGKLGQIFKIPGADKLASAGKSASGAGAIDAAAGNLDTSASSLSAAAGELSTAAGKIESANPVIPKDEPADGNGGGLPAGGKPEENDVKQRAESSAESDVEGGAEGGAGFLGINAISKFFGKAGGEGGGFDTAGMDAAKNPIVAGVAAGLILRGFSDSQAPKGTPAGQISADVQRSNPMSPDWAIGGLIGKAGTSSIGLDIGSFLTKALGLGAPAVVGANQESRFSSRFGITEPGTVASAPPKPVPVNKWSAAFAASNAAGSSEMHAAAKTAPLDMSSLDAGKAKALSSGEGIQQSVQRAVSKPVKFPAMDLSALTSAKARVASDAAGIGQAASSALKKPAKMPAPDMSSLDAAKAKAMSAGQGISQGVSSAMKKPAKMTAPDLSSLDAAKAKAMSAGEGIQQAAQTAVQKPVHAASPDLSAYAAAAGPARADGAQIDAGLAGGIRGNEGVVVAAAQAVAAAASAAMASALQVKSPSRVTAKIGEETSAGLAKGIKDGTDKAKTSALTLSAATITSITEGLQGGKSAVDAAMQAVTGKGSRPQDITTIISTISTLKGDVAKALADKQISKPEDSALTKLLAADNTKLQALSAQRAKIEQEITDAGQIAQQAISNASIMNAQQATPIDPTQAVSSIAIIQGMQTQATQAKQFAQQIGELGKKGLNATSLNQITQSGATAGLPITQSLLSGGPKAIQQINALEKQIQGSASKLGNSAAPAMYAAGAAATAGLAAGLKSSLAGIDKAITSMADQIVASVKKALKIKSPSQVMHDLGVFLPQGLARGIEAESAIAESAASKMAAGVEAASKMGPSAVNTAHGIPSPPSTTQGMPQQPPGGWAPAGGDGAAVVHHHYHTHNTTVQGSIRSDKDFSRIMQSVYYTNQQSNSAPVLPGRPY